MEQCEPYLSLPILCFFFLYASLLRLVFALLDSSRHSDEDGDQAANVPDEQARDDGQAQASFQARAKRFALEVKVWITDLRHDYLLINMLFIAQARLVLMADVFTDAALSADELSKAHELAATSPAIASLHQNSGLTLLAVILLPYFLMTAFMFPIHPFLHAYGSSEELVTFESLEDVSFEFRAKNRNEKISKTDFGGHTFTQYIPEDTYGSMALPLRVIYATIGG